MEWSQFINGRANISDKGRKTELTEAKAEKIVISIMDLPILKDGRVHFRHLGMTVYLLEIITPFLKSGPIPFLWNSLFQNFRGEVLEKLCDTPF